MHVRRSLSLVLLAVVAASACSDATGPESQDVNGEWAGSFVHPAYDGGSLSLALTDANGVVDGTYRLRLTERVGSRTRVEQSGGRISGASVNGRLTLRLQRSDGSEWLLEGRIEGSSVSGEWRSGRRTRGSFSLTR